VDIPCLTENSNRDDVRVRAMRLDKQSSVRDEADLREVTEEGRMGIGNASDCELWPGFGMGDLDGCSSNRLVASRAKAKRFEREVPELAIDALDHCVGYSMFKILGFETRVFTAVAESLNQERFKKPAPRRRPNRMGASRSAEPGSSERQYRTLVRGPSPGPVRRHGRHHMSLFWDESEQRSGCGRQPRCSSIRLNRGGTESAIAEAGSGSRFQGLVSSTPAAGGRP
jgi:hypothetical protein